MEQENADESPYGVGRRISDSMWRDALYASMMGTPEAGALSLARRFVKEKDEAEATAFGNNFPNLRGFSSYIFYPSESFLNDREGTETYSSVGYAYPEVIRTYEQIHKQLRRKNPDLNAEALEHKAVLQTANIIARSTEYNPPGRSPSSPYRAHFAEQMAWARLGTQAGAQLKGVRQKMAGVDLHNIGRFVGKSGNNRHAALHGKAQQIEELLRSWEGPWSVEPLREHMAELVDEGAYGYDEAVRDELKAQIRTAGKERLQGMFAEKSQAIEQKYHRAMSPLLKAIQLQFSLSPNRIRPFPENDYHETPIEIDWINDAPLGLIKRTYRAIHGGGVSLETANAYAIAEQYLGDAGPITSEVVRLLRE